MDYKAEYHKYKFLYQREKARIAGNHYGGAVTPRNEPPHSHFGEAPDHPFPLPIIPDPVPLPPAPAPAPAPVARINYPWFWDDDGVRVYKFGDAGERVYHTGDPQPEHLNLNREDPLYRTFIEWLTNGDPESLFNDAITRNVGIWNVGMENITQEAPFFIKALLRKLRFQAVLRMDRNRQQYKSIMKYDEWDRKSFPDQNVVDLFGANLLTYIRNLVDLVDGNPRIANQYNPAL
jgi:hypothetical protein